MSIRLVLWLSLMLAAASAPAAQFLSIADNATLMYDAPSLKANKIFVATKYYPVEVIVQVDAWVKVRDAAGDLAWVEKKFLSETRMVVVTAEAADVREKAEDGARLVFRARRGVALEVAEIGTVPWVKVRHRDGQAGFLRANQVWGL